MAELTTGKIAEVIFENMLDTYEHNSDILKRVNFYMPDAATLQNANNEIWRPVQQHAPIIEGWDLTNDKQGILEQVYRHTLGEPVNDIVELQADDVRDIRFWERRGKQSGLKQADELNKRICQNICNEGAVFYDRRTDSGFDFISRASTLLNEKEIVNSGTRTFVLNPRDNLAFSKELARRQSVEGKPETAWGANQVGESIAGFNVYKGAYLPVITGGSLGTTVRTKGAFVPNTQARSGEANLDYRQMDIVVDSTTGRGFEDIKVGDKLTFNEIYSLSLTNKINLSKEQVFTVVRVGETTGNSQTTRQRIIRLYPHASIMPRGAPSGALTDTDPFRMAFANTSSTDGTIIDNTQVNRLNDQAFRRTNVFFDKYAVEVMGGTVPAELFKQFNGYKVISNRMDNGQEVYMLFAGNINNMTFTFRIFTWYGITVRDPFAAGCAVRDV